MPKRLRKLSAPQKHNEALRISAAKIPDGKWIAETSTFHERVVDQMGDCEEIGSFFVIGSPSYDVICHDVDIEGDVKTNGSIERFVTLVSDGPFGIIEETYVDGTLEGRWFVCARKLKGDRGRFPPQTKRPPALLPKEEQVTDGQSDKEKPPHRLSSLKVVAEMLEMTPREVLYRFLPFSDRDDPKIQVYVSKSESAPENGWWMTMEINEGSSKLLKEHGDFLWIRSRYAMAMIQMVYFNFVPPMPAYAP